MRKVIRYRLGGGLGNRMFEVMLAHRIAWLVRRSVVTGPPLPEWNFAPHPVRFPQRHLIIGGHRVDIARIAYLLQAGLVDGVETAALGCRMELLIPLPDARRLWTQPEPAESPGDDALVISIRGAEILEGVHRDYQPLPLAFYARLIAETGLRPVFLGQIAEDPYSQALRARFPDATFIPSRGAMADFAALRAARHICVSVSTFAWLAAWLSEAETIHLPLAGMFHPAQRPDVDLLPLSDPRYRYHLFPVQHWTGAPAQLQAAIAGEEAGRSLPRDAALLLVQGSAVLERR